MLTAREVPPDPCSAGAVPCGKPSPASREGQLRELEGRVLLLLQLLLDRRGLPGVPLGLLLHDLVLRDLRLARLAALAALLERVPLLADLGRLGQVLLLLGQLIALVCTAKRAWRGSERSDARARQPRCLGELAGSVKDGRGRKRVQGAAAVWSCCAPPTPKSILVSLVSGAA